MTNLNMNSNINTMLEVFKLTREGFHCDTTLICKEGEQIQTNSVFLSLLVAPCISKHFSQDPSEDGQVIISVPDVDKNEFLIFLEAILNQESICTAGQTTG